MPTYWSLAGGNLAQDWTDTSLIAADDNWDSVPSIIGYRGDAITGSTGTNPGTLTGDGTVTVDVIANQLNPNTNTSGGVAEFHLADPTVALQGSGTADAPNLVIYLDATGRQDVTLSFNARDIDGSADNAIQPVAVQYRIGSTGAWTNLPAAYLADATSGPSLATLVTGVTVTLPAAVNGQPLVEVRIITSNAAGNDEWVGIDDILVTSAPASPIVPGALSVGDASVVEGDAGTTDLTFTVTRSGGDDGTVGATWTLANVSTDAADFAAGQPVTGTVAFADGQTSATVTISIAADTAFELAETFTLTLSAPTGGASLADPSGTGTITNDDAPPPIANVWINEINYDPASSPDTGEYVEVAGLAGTDLSGWSLVFYNGNGGASYRTINLSGTLTDSADGFGFATANSPVNDGIQNGAPDAIALVDQFGRVVQFLSYEGVMTAVGGPANGMVSTDIGVFQQQAPTGTSLQLIGTGSSYSDFSWAYDIASTTGATNTGQSFLSGSDQGQIRIANAQVVEGDAGTASLTFTVTRSGGFATAADVAYTLSFGTADSADLAPGTPLTGSVHFEPNQFTATVTVPIAGDLVGEYNESLFVTLGAVTGNAVVVDDLAVGTIVNDDRIALTIMQIQGEGHASGFAGQPVTTTGIVTVVDTNGFYLQDPDGDGNSATSDAIFVYTGGAPAVAVGDAISVDGNVAEFGFSGGLTTTEITSPVVTVVSSGNPLPAAVLVGQGGYTPPTQSIDSDNFAVFNPAVDGIDFWESLEGMRVTLDTPLAVSDTNADGETYVVTSGGVGATGINADGGITISPGDFNPETIQIDDRFAALTGYAPNHSTGDLLGSVTGVIGYSNDRFELLATQDVTILDDNLVVAETTTLVGDANSVTIATYNLENLDPNDGKYFEIASDIVNNLLAPDIIAVQEIQDSNGNLPGGDLSGATTAQGLIDAIYVTSGIQYAYVEVAPASNNSTGGEPNGNIRSGYFYRVDTVSYVEGSARLITDPAFGTIRSPLVAEWVVNGQSITTVNVHLTARSNSDPLWGSDQPPSNAGDGARTTQLAAVGNWIEDQLATNPDLRLALVGDFNGFYFEEAQTQLTETGVLTNLQELLLTPEDRYSYVFEGNAQLIDNLLVTANLLGGAEVDAVHLNAQFSVTGRPTDHDPQLMRLTLGTTPYNLTAPNASVAENAAAGTIVTTASASDSIRDTLTYSLVDNGGGLFAIDGTTGVITTTSPINFEAQPSVAIVVRATDTGGNQVDSNVTVTVTDVNETPTATDNAASVEEDATTGNLWSQLLGDDSDPDAGDTLTIVSVDTSATHGSVIFDAASETLRYVADGDDFDALPTGTSVTDSFTYTIRDAAGLTSTATVTMIVTAIADGIALSAGNGSDRVEGTSGEDRLLGNNGNDTLYGLGGHDRLDGGNGDDFLFGGSGNDMLIGARGNDVLEGGSGNDRFVFGKGGGADIVTDFDIANDMLALVEGQSVRTTSVGDRNGDGIDDLLIQLTGGGTITLSGVSSFGDVRISRGMSLDGQLSGSFAAVSPAPIPESPFVTKASGHHGYDAALIASGGDWLFA